MPNIYVSQKYYLENIAQVSKAEDTDKLQRALSLVRNAKIYKKSEIKSQESIESVKFIQDLTSHLNLVERATFFISIYNINPELIKDIVSLNFVRAALPLFDESNIQLFLKTYEKLFCDTWIVPIAKSFYMASKDNIF